VLIIPNLSIHRKWERKILGKSFREIDEFIDNAYSDIDTYLLMDLLKNRGKIDLLEFYTRCIRGPDPWRICSEIFFLYIYSRYGVKCLETAFIHVFLDLFVMNMSTIEFIDTESFTKIVDDYVDKAITTYLSDLPESIDILIDVSKKIKSNLAEILRDVLNWIMKLGKARSISEIESIDVYHESYLLSANEIELIESLERHWHKSSMSRNHISSNDLLRYKSRIREFLLSRTLLDELFGAGVSVNFFNITGMQLNELIELRFKVNRIASSSNISLLSREERPFYRILGETAVITGGYMLVVKFIDEKAIFYPHSVVRDNELITVTPLDFLIYLIETNPPIK